MDHVKLSFTLASPSKYKRLRKRAMNVGCYDGKMRITTFKDVFMLFCPSRHMTLE